MRELAFRVIATPAPQGSFFAMIVAGRPRIIADNKATAPWRRAVVTAAKNAQRATDWLPLNGPVRVELVFLLDRPKSVKRPLPQTRPDIDKLARSTLDALQSSGVIVEDGRVADLVLSKRYADGVPAGCQIRITDLAEVLL